MNKANIEFFSTIIAKHLIENDINKIDTMVYSKSGLNYQKSKSQPGCHGFIVATIADAINTNAEKHKLTYITNKNQYAFTDHNILFNGNVIKSCPSNPTELIAETIAFRHAEKPIQISRVSNSVMSDKAHVLLCSALTKNNAATDQFLSDSQVTKPKYYHERRLGNKISWAYAELTNNLGHKIPKTMVFSTLRNEAFLVTSPADGKESTNTERFCLAEILATSFADNNL